MRPRRPLGAVVAASMVGDPAVLAYADAVVANGGTVSVARYPILTAFVGAEKASGAWALTDDYWALWAENAAQALTSLKQRRLASAVSAPTFTANRDYTFDGAANYLNAGFIPSTHGAAMTGTNLRIGVYERTNPASAQISAACGNSGTQGLYIIANTGGVAVGRMNCGSLSYTLPGNDSRGYTAVSRSGADATGCAGYRNGAALAQSGTVSFGTALPTVALYIGCYNAAGVAQSFRPASIGFVDVGAQLSAAQEAAHYTNIQAFATAVGASV